jgi:hypothetical protein
MDDGRTLNCKQLNLEDYLSVVIQLSKDHKTEQDDLLRKNAASAQAKFCATCKRFPEYCKCTSTESETSDSEDSEDSVCKKIEPHAVDAVTHVLRSAVWQAINGYISPWTKPVAFLNWCVGFSPIQYMTTNALARELQQEMTRRGAPFLVSITPEWLFTTPAFQRFVVAWQSGTAYYDMRRPAWLVAMFVFLTMCYGFIQNSKAVCLLGLFALWSSSIFGYFWHQMRMAQIEAIYVRKRDALPDYAKHIRDGSVSKGVLFVATLALGVKLISMWNNNRISSDPQSLTPSDIDSQPGWFGYMMDQIGWKSQSSVEGAIPEHVLTTCQKNLGWCDFVRSDGTQTCCNIVYPEKGYVWFPLHIFYPGCDMSKQPVEYVRGEVSRDDSRTSKFKFVAQLGVNTVAFEGMDMVECFVERCPDITSNLVKFLPLENMTGTSVCTLMLRTKEAKLDHDKVVVKHGTYGHMYKTMPGGSYTTPKAVKGSCMAILVSREKQPVVAGFHIGGKTDANYGVMQTITQELVKKTRAALLEMPGIRGIAEATPLPAEQYGKPVIASSDVHPNAVYINSLTSKDAIDVLGSTRLRTEMKSRVVPSILQSEAMSLFRIENQWGAPRLRPNWKAFNATLEHIVNPSEMFVPALLQRARADWLKPILVFAKELNEKEPVRPLTMKESIMGIDGKRFIDAIPMNTSVGYPLFGAKKKKFTYVMEGERCVDRIPDDDILEEYERCIACWERGVRAYPVVSATLKDEPTKVTSEKVRVFQAIALAQGLAIRKWFLPIARVLSLCPEISESAVGVNAFSPQWDILMSHAEKFAVDDRVVAWDYSKYDVRMNSQMTYAVLQSFIDIAEVCEYGPYDLKMMNAMIADIIHPLIDYNGTMIMAYNINTSGNNITVNINGTANSLYVRMGFFDAVPEAEDFRSAVAAMTYGDDFKGSVEKQYRERFNFRVFKAFLAEHGMKITEPNKTDSVEDDLNIDDADFLKRQSHFIPEIGTRIGKLTKESMYKPLLMNVKSTTETPENVATSCVETYMHELFAHGRQEYEKDQPIMKELCVRVLGFTPPAVAFTFDERVEMWKEKYL